MAGFVVDGEEGEGEEEEEGDDNHQLIQPGVTFAPPTVSFDPSEIEALETGRMRRQAGALMDIIKVRGWGRGLGAHSLDLLTPRTLSNTHTPFFFYTPTFAGEAA